MIKVANVPFDAEGKGPPFYGEASGAVDVGKVALKSDTGDVLADDAAMFAFTGLDGKLEGAGFGAPLDGLGDECGRSIFQRREDDGVG